MPSYLERTMSFLKPYGFLTEKVEQFNVYANRRKDLYGFIDVLAISPAYGTVAVQACGSDFAPHIEKITGERREAAIFWLTSGRDNRLILIGWRKLKKTGWTPRIKEFTLADFPEVTPDILKIIQKKSVDNPFDLP